jgi:ArsR family transcriptional regulator, lead/cadmium/zinc/bismuth-responsive transcriptional repressor
MISWNVAQSSEAECDGSHAKSGPAQPVPAAGCVERAANLFRALGEPSRLRLLSRLLEQRYCVGDLAEAEGEAMSTISQRLRVLRAENIVVRRRQGKHVLYLLVDSHVKDLIMNALAHAEETPELEPDQEQD